MSEKKERRKMRKPPKIETIKGKINAYAYKCGFTYHPQEDGTFALFDIHMGYYVCRGSHDRIVQFVVDELWAKYYRLCHS
jgi:hypothetical protein